MDNNPWELLDIDDSNLPSFVRLTNQSSSNSTTLILGPAGAVQVAMMYRQSKEPLPAQEFIMCPHQVTIREFNKNPWLCALDFVRSKGFFDYTFDHVPLTIVIIKLYPQRFWRHESDAQDPTGTIDATMKWIIIKGQDCSQHMTDIHAVVFCPFLPHSKCYLNITLHNVVKINSY
ncbi:hypothetical protein GmHk_03G007705 [Glycine max]|nr:hypothetical protein GmHk_03G007705 [Glycine max]